VLIAFLPEISRRVRHLRRKPPERHHIDRGGEPPN
jgi:hypothetical protein